MPILTLCGTLSFVLGVLNLIYAKFCGSTQKWGEIILFFAIFFAEFSFAELFFGTLGQFFLIFEGYFCSWPVFFQGVMVHSF